MRFWSKAAASWSFQLNFTVRSFKQLRIWARSVLEMRIISLFLNQDNSWWSSNFDWAGKSAIFMVQKPTLFPKCQLYEKKVTALAKIWRQNRIKFFRAYYILYTLLKYEVVENGLDWFGRKGRWELEDPVEFFHSRFFMCFLVKVATFTFGWRWPLSLSDFHFLSFVHFVILDCSSCIWNATDEGAIALKALVFVWNKCQNWDSQIGG